MGVVASLVMATGTSVMAEEQNTKLLNCELDFEFTSTWQNGFVGVISVTNNSDKPIEDWEVSFRSSFSIEDDWNGTITSEKEMEGGREYTYKAEVWNDAIEPGETVKIGMEGVWRDTLLAPHKLRLNGQESGKPKLQGFYASWSPYSGYNPMDIPLEKLDRVTHAFAMITDSGLVTTSDEWAELHLPMAGDTVGQELKGIFHQYELIREQHPDLEICYSIVARDHNRKGFKYAASTPENRTAFAQAAITYMKKYNFDGVSLDWEFPEADDTENYTLLLAELRRQLDIEGFEAGHYYDVEVAISAGWWFSRHTNMRAIEPYVDQYALMGYDYFGPWTAETGMNSALYSNAAEMGLEGPLANQVAGSTIDWSVNFHLGNGVPAHKLVVVMPIYSHHWINVDNSLGRNGLYTAGTAPKNYEAPDGTLHYSGLQYKDAVALLDSGYTQYWDDVSKSGWLYNPDVDGGHMVTFEDPKAINAKCNYIKDMGLRGGSFWHLAGDTKNETSLITEANKTLK